MKNKWILITLTQRSNYSKIYISVWIRKHIRSDQILFAFQGLKLSPPSGSVRWGEFQYIGSQHSKS